MLFIKVDECVEPGEAVIVRKCDRLVVVLAVVDEHCKLLHRLAAEGRLPLDWPDHVVREEQQTA